MSLPITEYLLLSLIQWNEIPSEKNKQKLTTIRYDGIYLSRI